MSENQSSTPDEPAERDHPLLSLGVVVRDALPLIREAIADKAVLRIAVDAHAPLVRGSPVALQRVLLNLVLMLLEPFVSPMVWSRLG
jgi:C4-dicarboxylate-specific signal transduction histidine kinase